MKDILIKELNDALFINHDFLEAKTIFSKIVEFDLIPTIKENIYDMVTLMTYYTVNQNHDLLKELLEHIDHNYENYSKYEQYFYYYFYAMYFILTEYNYKAAMFTLKLIDIKKFRKYLQWDYKDYFYGILLSEKAFVYSNNGDFSNAELYYKRSLRTYKNMDSKKRVNYIQFGLALNKFREGHYDEALTILYKLEEIHKNVDNRIYMYISIIELLNGNLDECIKYYNKINFEITNRTVYIMNTLILPAKLLGSLIYSIKGEYTKAKSIFEEINLDNQPVPKLVKYDYKVIKAFVYKDFSKETIDFIESTAIPYYNFSNKKQRPNLINKYIYKSISSVV